VGESDGLLYVAMELIDGRTLTPKAEGEPPADVVRYGLQIADALAHAHQSGVIHCDLKCANIMVASDGRTKILDFGLARRNLNAGDNTLTKTAETTGGPPAYMAPDLLRGAPPDARSDIWALGVILYELACGKRPFKGRTNFELTADILRGSTPAISADVPPGL